MRLEEALPALRNACNRRFGELFPGHSADLKLNKGNVGQLLLLYLGLPLDSKLTDFENGELKSNKASPDGMPKETMFITQISKNIDSFIGPERKSFSESNLYLKAKNLVYLPVVKESKNASDWYFTHCIHIQTMPGSPTYKALEEDYETICDGLAKHIENSADGFIHTTNGPNYVQVRSKDSKPYHPIFSKHLNRYVSNKNHALYFKKSFMIDAINGRLNA